MAVPRVRLLTQATLGTNGDSASFAAVCIH